MERKTEDRKMLWIDLETTGDRPDEDAILEVGWMLTDYYNFEDVLDDGQHWVVFQPFPYKHLVTVPAVYEMHTNSGLFDDLDNPDFPKASLLAIEAEIIATMEQYGDDNTKWVIAGSGVSQLDAHFIRWQMPMLHAALAYFYMDIGQVRRFLRDMVDFKLSLEAEEHYRHVREIGHRAYDDIKAHHMEAVLIRDELRMRGLSLPETKDF